MKTGRTLTELAQELQRQTTTRKDYLAPQGAIEAVVVEEGPDTTPVVKLAGFNGEAFALNNYAHQQLGDHLGIPAKYYTRLREEQPQLLADNVNTWLKADPGNKRMIRTLDGRVRGFLSHKFRPLDNAPLATVVLPLLLKRKIQVISAELTETRFYIKAILPDLSDALPEGLVWGSGHTDITKVAPGLALQPEQNLTAFYGKETRGRLVAAVTISNSDVGAGTLQVAPSVFTTWCSNLAVLIQAKMRKYHIGRSWEADSNFEIFEDDTRQADDEAFWLKVRDTVEAAFSEEAFAAAVAQIRSAGSRELQVTDLGNVVEQTVKQLALPVDTAPNILNFLARGGDLTQWGLSSAITAAANVADTYEQATQLEYAGGQVLALNDGAWRALEKAAA